MMKEELPPFTQIRLGHDSLSYVLVSVFPESANAQ